MELVGYNYILEPYKGQHTRHTCPDCNHKREFTRYIDTTTGNYLADHVGRCNRESTCGYHLTPSEWIKTGGVLENSTRINTERAKPEPLPISYIPSELVLRSLNGFKSSNFGRYISTLFGDHIATNTLINYCVGRSKADNGTASIFWRIDIDDNVRTGKVVCYNSVTGKRKKEDSDPKPFFIHSKMDGNFAQCFFGEHLLKLFPDKPVGVVESEKTAVICSVYMPYMVWIATGGASGCKWRDYAVYKALSGRTAIFYPDYGYFNRKTQKTCFEEWTERVQRVAEVLPGKFTVSRILEDNFTPDERLKDMDLADLLIKQDPQTGAAICDEGYPITWDIDTSLIKQIQTCQH